MEYKSKSWMLDDIIEFAFEGNWGHEKGDKKKLRKRFMEWCSVNNVDPASSECENALKKIFYDALIYKDIDFEKFKKHMLKKFIAKNSK